MYLVKQLSDLAGISVRTLHHYDAIGLLRPTATNEKGYRLYSEADLEKLQQILFFKELDFPLQEIQRILHHPHYNRTESLLKHKHLLNMKKERLEKIMDSIEATLKSMEEGKEMTKEEMFKPFDMAGIKAHQEKYQAEVEARWGESDAYKESARRTKYYTEADWKRIQIRSQEINNLFIEAMPRGATSPEAQAACSAHWQFMSDNFYTMTLEIYRGLAEMYIADPRFTKNIDKAKEGLAQFMQDAMIHYCEEQG